MMSLIAGLRCYMRDARAATAVEFAIIGAAFFLFIFGIFVVSIDQFWQMTLDDAVRAATRQVQIGKITTGSGFVNQVCGEFGIAAPYCTNTLQYSVQSGLYFGALVPATFSSAGTLAPAAQFSVTPTTAPAAATQTQAAVIGTPQFLLVQVAYLLPFKILAVPGGVATENGTSSLYSVIATVMEP